MWAEPLSRLSRGLVLNLAHIHAVELVGGQVVTSWEQVMCVLGMGEAPVRFGVHDGTDAEAGAALQTLSETFDRDLLKSQVDTLRPVDFLMLGPSAMCRLPTLAPRSDLAVLGDEDIPGGRDLAQTSHVDVALMKGHGADDHWTMVAHLLDALLDGVL